MLTRELTKQNEASVSKAVVLYSHLPTQYNKVNQDIIVKIGGRRSARLFLIREKTVTQAILDVPGIGNRRQL